MMEEFFSKEKLIENIGKINVNIALVVFLIFAAGVGLLYSAANGKMSPWALRQTIFFVSFLPASILIAVLDTNFFFKYSYVFYFIGLSLLIFVEIKGHRAMGATRWINFGLFTAQPSEIMKVCLILQLGKYFYLYDIRDIQSNRKLIIPLACFAAPALLILKQPNLGTAIILTVITFGIFFLVGVQMWKFWSIFLALVFLLPFI
ncbi:MAG: FtsW/RodA/SpoVE family cell cycle protein, partial [Rickettsiales bacterium]|nr:FtsW/RodA/SpoVE family cell cycle protein [Rickettsiales bacterium]